MYFLLVPRALSTGYFSALARSFRFAAAMGSIPNSSQSRSLSPDAHAAASEEAADVLLYLIRLCDELGIDPIVAAQHKLVANAEKYPVGKARGTHKKYTEL